MLPHNFLTFLLISPTVAYVAGQDNEEKLQSPDLPAITAPPAITATVNQACNCPIYTCAPNRYCQCLQEMQLCASASCSYTGPITSCPNPPSTGAPAVTLAQPPAQSTSGTARKECGGIYNWKCPTDQVCIDNPSDQCVPGQGDYDCPAYCVSKAEAVGQLPGGISF